jgi:hypothetical protein
MKINKKERKIRREYQEEKIKKLCKKRKKRKKLGHMIAPVHNIDLKYFVDFIYFWRSNKKQRNCGGRGGGARSAPFGVAMNPKRRVRAAHGRARADKTH